MLHPHRQHHRRTHRDPDFFSQFFTFTPINWQRLFTDERLHPHVRPVIVGITMIILVIAAFIALAPATRDGTEYSAAAANATLHAVLGNPTSDFDSGPKQ